MPEYSSITDISTLIKEELCVDLNKKSITLLYAFNATGKTRLSVEFDALNNNEEGEIKVLSYNAFLEDLFIWDNESYILKFSKSSWVVKLVEEQGLEKDIVDNFKAITNSKIEPSFNFEAGEIVFDLASGDDSGESNIKISKSEESMLIWSIFHSVLETAIDALNTEEEENRTTDKFNNLEYIVIDDPVSSIDDARIIAMAIKLFETIQSSKNKKTNFLITTHHALFYNVLFNSIKNLKKTDAKRFFYILSKKENILELIKQGDDSPFAYHLLVKRKIKDAVDSDNIEKYHFNLFRSLLEKTANFLGHKNFEHCIPEERRNGFKKVLHLHSHGKLSELESSHVSNEDKELFKETFNKFIENFRYN